MKKVDIRTSDFTEVFYQDEKGPGGAFHDYEVRGITGNRQEYATVFFQNGPIKENGINGCHNEDLLAIVIHRLESFQAGDYRCRENAIAITKLEEAMHWLMHRTSARVKRGVEGTSEK
jgi:hypothetical protein